ncbi:non-specific lipid transfer protein GPI-anchored 15-like [Phragmites australis]|uniref:non-specific lipid transfer protein GPI-anchored 15-like n=1 Tax=Phragmites australis TaxID=29695 RepID=UPI002D798245|nr:non-specific lipid transfer protein GPI-anchored 15-like [Phragmites australis]
MVASGRARATPLCLLVLAAAAVSLLLAAAARPGASECTSALVSLSPCVDYMSGDDTTAMSRCCSQLRSVSRSKPQCLCAALGVDRTRALGLPAACNVQAPPVNECNLARATPEHEMPDQAAML